MKHYLWREGGFASYEYAWRFVKCTYRKHSMLLKSLAFALYASPLWVQALQSSLVRVISKESRRLVLPRTYCSWDTLPYNATKFRYWKCRK
jgi:hypothetical protein